ncbi:MAG: hypothetical protein QOJ11_3541 [Frankiales bacterium]|nr:hypothetical protein [Frankiales bacterium]
MPATIADVAKRAGVSASTVSYVLSGNRPISEATRRRVEESIAALQFRPHAGARSIRTRTTGVIAMATPLIYGLHNQVQMQFVAATLARARVHGLRVLMLTDDDGQAEIRDVVNRAMVDGVIVMEVRQHDLRVPLLESLSRPAVVIGTPVSDSLVHVDFDFTAAGEGCVDHLAGLGHRHLGYLGQSPETFELETSYALRTRDGFFAACARASVSGVWSPCEPTTEGVSAALDALLREDPDLTGLVVYQESALAMVLEQMQRRGYAIPQDLSVVAICPDELATSIVPHVTAMSLPAEELASLAVDRLAGLIAERDQPLRTILPPSIASRDSAGPVPPRRRRRRA